MVYLDFSHGQQPSSTLLNTYLFQMSVLRAIPTANQIAEFLCGVWWSWFNVDNYQSLQQVGSAILAWPRQACPDLQSNWRILISAISETGLDRLP